MNTNIKINNYKQILAENLSCDINSLDSVVSPSEFSSLLGLYKPVNFFVGDFLSEEFSQRYINVINKTFRANLHIHTVESDGLLTVENLLEQVISYAEAVRKHKIVSDNTNLNQDIIGCANTASIMNITLLKVREGRLISKEDFDIKLDEIHTPYEAIIAYIQEYYSIVSREEIPKEIIISVKLDAEDTEVLSEWLSNLKQSKVKIVNPKLQKKLELAELADKNAAAALEALKVAELGNIKNNWNKIGTYIQKKLNLIEFPNRIECFDISHTQGTNTVASMVVFVNGKPLKSDYRKFKIKNTKEGKPDDFACMKEVIQRRYSKLLSNDEYSKKFGDAPDLIIVDGGKGQLSSALEALKEISIDIPIVSLAKKFEEVFIPEESTPVIIEENSEALFLFQQIRDEAHRFAITFHRQLRSKKATQSLLDEVKSLKITHKKALLEHFGDINGIINASKADIIRVAGKYQGAKLFSFLHKKEPKS